MLTLQRHYADGREPRAICLTRSNPPLRADRARWFRCGKPLGTVAFSLSLPCDTEYGSRTCLGFAPVPMFRHLR
jgi:hypothetical protein